MAFFIEKYKTAYDNCNGDEKLLNELKEKITASLKHCDESSNNLTDEQSTPVSPTQKATVTANSDSLLSFSLGNGVTLEMIKVKAGYFTTRSAGKQLNIAIPGDYWLGKFPVTQAQYREIRKYNPSQFSGGRRPVERVSIRGIKLFCHLLNSKFKDQLPQGYHFDLPTKAQWEYACRAGTTTDYFWGDADDDSCANCNRRIGKTTIVGSYRANAWGFYDMHGNVRECCKPEGNVVVLKGGSWSSSIYECCSDRVEYQIETDATNDVGFRLALVPV